MEEAHGKRNSLQLYGIIWTDQGKTANHKRHKKQKNNSFLLFMADGFSL
jgi:hypothetical protein